jgi:hypothetical protein
MDLHVRGKETRADTVADLTKPKGGSGDQELNTIETPNHTLAFPSGRPSSSYQSISVKDLLPVEWKNVRDKPTPQARVICHR